MANGEDKKARELVSIAIDGFSKWTGETTVTDKRYGDGVHKFSLRVPVPMNDEESMEALGVPLSTVIRIGSKQIWYSARHVDNTIKELAGKGINPNSDEAILAMTAAVEEQTFVKEEKVATSSKMKALKAEADTVGGVDEALRIISEYKKLKAEGKIA